MSHPGLVAIIETTLAPFVGETFSQSLYVHFYSSFEIEVLQLQRVVICKVSSWA